MIERRSAGMEIHVAMSRRAMSRRRRHLRRAELFAPHEETEDGLSLRLIDEPNGVVTFAGFEEHATVDESFVRFEGRRLERLRRLDDGMFRQIARRRAP